VYPLSTATAVIGMRVVPPGRHATSIVAAYVAGAAR
jgi:hypothetical protein